LEITDLSDDAESDESFSFNDAGDKLVYVSHNSIYTMDVDGGNKFEVLGALGINWNNPVFQK